MTWHLPIIVWPQRFEAFCVDWLCADAQLVGGSCGLGVAHVEAASRARDIVLAERRR